MAVNRKIEALAEAITAYSGYQDPDSALHAARNPGGLQAYLVKHERDAEGNRVFTSLVNGHTALLYDLEFKIRGRSKSALQPTDTLADLAVAFGKHKAEAGAWAKFIRKALKDESLTTSTNLSYFLE